MEFLREPTKRTLLFLGMKSYDVKESFQAMSHLLLTSPYSQTWCNILSLP
jgi:hypothetical protein